MSEILQNRRKNGSMVELLAIGPFAREATITLRAQRYGSGYYALLMDGDLAKELLDCLHSGDAHWSSVEFGMMDQPWFPGAIGDSPVNAIRALAQKLDGMTDVQYLEVFAITCQVFNEVIITDPSKLPGRDYKGYVDCVLTLVPTLRKTDILTFT